MITTYARLKLATTAKNFLKPFLMLNCNGHASVYVSMVMGGAGLICGHAH